MKHSILFKRITAIFTALVLVLLLPSCKSEPEETTAFQFAPETEEQIPGGSLSVPYNSMDCLNPFFCRSVFNSTVTSLVYRSLYRLSSSYTAERDLAEGESLTDTSLTVTILPDLVFSDGSVLDAEDVEYSFRCAKNSFIYASGLEGILSCTVKDEHTLVFELSYPMASYINALTFPIVKNLTADTEDALPTGCGFYQFSRDGVRLSLKANLKYAGELPDIGTVRLTDVKGNVNPENLVTTGEIDFCYSDLADSNITGVNSSVTSVYLNNLVYMGINHENINLALASFRQALYYGINRQNIVASAFRGYARAAAAPFNTAWSVYSSSASASSLSLSGDPEKTKGFLEERGFGENGNPLDLLLVCNEENAFIRNAATSIASDLAPFNINVTVQFLSSDELKKTVEKGEYDLYIAEIKVPATMELSQFFTEDGAASYGINFENCICDEAYFRYLSGEIGLDNFIAYFNSDMPFVPLVYRNARLCYTRDVTSSLSATEGAVFGDINKWTFSENMY